MFVLFTTRVVKHNTGHTEKFQPRTANREDTYVSGPFLRLGHACAAASKALGTHTCLAAWLMSKKQVEDAIAKGWSHHGGGMWQNLQRAKELLDVKEGE